MTESNPEEQAEPLVSTHRVRMNFGTYKGKLVTRLPVSYLKWMVTNSIAVKLTLLDGTEMDAYIVAGSEIVRRGMRLATSDVSPHAIDRLSQKHISKWRKTRTKDEGLYSWTQRMVEEARAHSVTSPSSIRSTDGEVLTIQYQGIKWVIDTGKVIPVLLTVKELTRVEKDASDRRRNNKRTGKNRRMENDT